MYDASKLKSLGECRTVMQRARERNLPEVYKTVFRRMCQLVGSANDDPNDLRISTKHSLPTSSCSLKRTDAPPQPLEHAKRFRTRACINR
jgi:hypothetical protein